MRRGPLLVALLVAAAAAAAGLALRLRIRPRSVVLVTIDTLRDDRVGPGAARPTSLTPRLDALAARGARFDVAWTVAPLTVPAHATLLTGRLPAQHGLRTNRPARRLAPRSERTWATLAETLRSAGYRTAAFTSASVLRKDRTGLDAGFDVYDEVGPAKPGSLLETERRAEETVARALAWVAQDDDRPFFLWVHVFDPHAPYDAPQPFGAGPAHVTTPRGYDAEVAYADRCVGDLLDGLAARAPAVAVTSDHGESLGEHGESTHGFLLHEATLRVPLLLADGGETVVPGTRVAEPVSLLDVPATLLGLARVPPSEGGIAGQGLLGGRTHSLVYAESLYGHDASRWAQAFALRLGPWKLVDAGAELRETDLSADPGELSPVVHDPLRPGSAARPVAIEDALATLRAAASGPSTGGAAPEAVQGLGYAGAAGGSLLATAENRRLPSPYARIGDLAVLETGQALLGAGDAVRALTQFDELARRDPANPQAPFWRGRALMKLEREAEAAEAFRRTHELGWRDAPTVEKALQASAAVAVRALQGGGGPPDEVARALAFLETARGRGVPDSGMTAVFEAYLRHAGGDAAGARAALDRARGFAPADPLPEWIRRAEELLARSRP